MGVEEERALIESHLIILAWAIPLALITLFCAIRWGYFTLPEKKEEKHVVHFYHVLFVFFLFFLCQFLTAFLGSALIYLLKVPSSAASGWLDVCSILISSSVVLLFTYRMKLIAGEIWGKTEKARSFLFGVLTLALSYPFVIVVGQSVRLIMFYLFRAEEVDQSAVNVLKRSFENPFLFYTFVTVVIFIVPIIEELLFRGYLQEWLRGWLGRRRAIALGGMIFSAFHFSFSQGFSNVELLTSLFLLSLFLGFLYEKTRSLFAPIGLHMAFNTLNILILFR